MCTSVTSLSEGTLLTHVLWLFYGGTCACRWNILCRAHNLLIRAHEIRTRAQLSRATVCRAHEIRTRAHDLLSRDSRPKSCARVNLTNERSAFLLRRKTCYFVDIMAPLQEQLATKYLEIGVANFTWILPVFFTFKHKTLIGQINLLSRAHDIK